MWALSYIGANWALILVVVLAVAALGAIAWFAKNWKIAVAALIVLGLAFTYQQIDKSAYQRRVNEEKAKEVKLLKERIATLSKVNEEHAERAINDATEIGRLEADASVTPANDSPCLDRDAAERVFRIR